MQTFVLTLAALLLHAPSASALQPGPAKDGTWLLQSSHGGAIPAPQQGREASNANTTSGNSDPETLGDAPVKTSSGSTGKSGSTSKKTKGAGKHSHRHKLHAGTPSQPS